MKNMLLVYTKTDNKNKLINKLNELNVGVYNIKYNKDIVIFEISKKDYIKINKYIKTYEFKIKRKIGYHYYLDLLKKRKIFILNIILFLIIINILSNTIISVDVIHSKKEIRTLLYNSLEDYGIKKFSLKKNYKDIQNIKEKILNKYPDKIEWLEIEQVGMIYRVRVEEKIVPKIKKEEKYCHVIAKKDGTITKIISDRGQILKEKNEYVKKGDVIISGEIFLNEEVKNNVCASGKVYANVWYNVKVSLPINYELVKYTGKKRYNLMINKTKIFKSRLKNYNTKKKKIFSIFGYDFYVLIEKEINKTKSKYSKKEAIDKSLSLSRDKINMKLGNNGHIINQKVLKNSVNDSTIYVEVFTSVEELISEKIQYVKEEKEVE